MEVIMRKLMFTALAVVLSVCALIAEPDTKLISIVLGSATGGTNTLSGVRGYIEDVYVTCSDGVSTGDVKVAFIPLDGVSAAVEVATNNVAGVQVFKPSVDRTDVKGTALTSDPPARYMVDGDSIRLIVTGSPTNKTWKAMLRLKK
jgi:hypothetical protein